MTAGLRDLSRLYSAGTIRDNEGTPRALLLPTADYVAEIVGILLSGTYPFEDAILPPSGTDLWRQDNLGMMCVILSGNWRDWNGRRGRDVAREIHTICPRALDDLVAGYLSAMLLDGVPMSFEQIGCNGSSVIPDVCEGGYWIKDPASVAHDHEWARHHAGDLPDCWGRRPDFHRSNRHYRAILEGFGHEAIAEVRFQALEMLGRARWDGAD